MLEPRVPSYGVDPGGAQFKRRQGYKAGFQRSCVKVNEFAGR